MVATKTTKGQIKRSVRPAQRRNQLSWPDLGLGFVRSPHFLSGLAKTNPNILFATTFLSECMLSCPSSDFSMVGAQRPTPAFPHVQIPSTVTKKPRLGGPASGYFRSQVLFLCRQLDLCDPLGGLCGGLPLCGHDGGTCCTGSTNCAPRPSHLQGLPKKIPSTPLLVRKGTTARCWLLFPSS